LRLRAILTLSAAYVKCRLPIDIDFFVKVVEDVGIYNKGYKPDRRLRPLEERQPFWIKEKMRVKKDNNKGIFIRHGDAVLLTLGRINPQAETGFNPDGIDTAVLSKLIEWRRIAIDMLKGSDREGLVLGKATGASNFKVLINTDTADEPLDTIFNMHKLQRTKTRA
jgi:hypothetical protein